MPDKKIAAITDFLQGLAEIRKAVKEDARKLIESVPPEILLDEESLAAFMEEMATELVKKYLINDSGKIIAAPARLISRYVQAMAVTNDN